MTRQRGIRSGESTKVYLGLGGLGFGTYRSTARWHVRKRARYRLASVGITVAALFFAQQLPGFLMDKMKPAAGKTND